MVTVHVYERDEDAVPEEEEVKGPVRGGSPFPAATASPGGSGTQTPLSDVCMPCSVPAVCLGSHSAQQDSTEVSAKIVVTYDQSVQSILASKHRSEPHPYPHFRGSERRSACFCFALRP
jgi:hypothetical protein